MRKPISLASLFLLLFAFAANAEDALAPDVRTAIDKAAVDVLARTGAPSASLAIVKDGKLVYANAYGSAHLAPPLAATSAMRYSIGSISKQFTAAAALLLAEEGRLSLDDKVVRWFPQLTRAKDISIRQLLSMTSGYQDFWPQDYVMPMMLENATPDRIMRGWAEKPLDFEPGTKWQYSNTNYVIAGAIVEKVSGMPLFDFLQKRIFETLGMASVYNTDEAALPASDPERAMRYALGPVRPAPKEGKGWMFGAGELAMTAADLAKWDIAMIDQKVLQPGSFRAMESEVQLNSGVGTRYGLGVSVSVTDGRRTISHGGEVSGFTANNQVFPDERGAIVVLTNLDATSTSDQIASKIAGLVFKTADPGKDAALAQTKAIFAGLQQGKIDRSLFTPNANAYFNEQALRDFASSLRPLGTPQEFVQQTQSLRGGMTLRRYRVAFPQKTLRAWTFAMPDGKLEQYMVAAAE